VLPGVLAHLMPVLSYKCHALIQDIYIYTRDMKSGEEKSRVARPLFLPRRLSIGNYKRLRRRGRKSGLATRDW